MSVRLDRFESLIVCIKQFSEQKNLNEAPTFVICQEKPSDFTAL